MRRRQLESISPYAIPALVVLVFYWKAVFLGHLFLTHDLGINDMTMHSFPGRAELADALKAARPLLWTDNVFLGFPIGAEGQVGAFYPPNALFFGLLSVERAYVLVTLLHVVLTGVFGMLYARSLGRSRASAALVGVTLVLSAYMVTRLKHVNLIASTAWIPLGFWVVERWSARTRRWWPGIWLGLLLALGVLAGHVQTAYYGLLVVSLYLLAAAVREGTTMRSARPILFGARVWVLMLAVGIGLSAVQIFPAYEYTQLSTRSAGLTYAEATQYEFFLEDLWMYLQPYRFGDPGIASYHAGAGIHSLFWENCGYVGIVPLVLALTGAIFCWRRRGVKFLVGLAVLSILLALGRGSPLYALFFHTVPGFDHFRFPHRFLLYATLSIAVLSAFGLDWFSGRLSSRSWVRSLVRILVVGLAMADLFAFGYDHNPTLPADLWLDPPESVRFLKTDTSQYRIWSPHAVGLHLRAHRDAVGWKGDLAPYVDHRNALPPNFNAVFGIQSVGSYFPVKPRLFSDKTVGLELKPPMIRRVLSLYNVKYVLMGSEIRDPRMALRCTVPGGVSIYENLDVLPRARWVPRGIPVVSPEHALAEITKAGFNPAETVVLEGWDGEGGGESADGSRVREVGRRGGRVELEVSAEDDGFLVVADAFYPGWEVWIDGKWGEILKANIACRAVALPPGEHRVVFRYRPGSFISGMIVTLVCLAIVGGVWVCGRARRYTRSSTRDAAFCGGES